MQKNLITALIDTPLGQMVAISDDEALCLLEFVDGRGVEREIENLRIKTQATIVSGVTNSIKSIEAELRSYFDGTLTAFKTPVRLFGSSFQQLVWYEIMRIPYGQTRSYAQEAHAIGKDKAYRAVANANGANQLAVIIPCHRIINSNGNLGGYGGGVMRKQWLIDHEKRFVAMTNKSHVSALVRIKSILQNSISVSMSSASGFFKTGVGHYAEHDIFIGVTVPSLRKIAQQFADLSLDDVQELITSKINEERLLALLILIAQYKKATSEHKEEIYQFYLKNLNHVNNWNLVDTSAHWIMGAHLWDRDRSILLVLGQSECLWRRRIAIVATWYFIRKNDLKWTFDLAHILLEDEHDLMHKAVGWMLREAGKRDENGLLDFLDRNVLKMPRTMLRYAIEKFPEQQRKKILALK